MLVPSMTFEEICREVEKDFPIFSRKTVYVAQELQKKISKAEKKKGYTEFFDYYSKYKNHWIYKVQLTNKTYNTAGVLLLHDGKHYAGITSTNQLEITYHTGHFFERYNERRHLGLNTIQEIVCAFLLELKTFKFQEIDEIAEGIFTVFGAIPSGIVLGLFNKPLMLVKANTFIANETLSNNQKERIVELEKSLEKYLDTVNDLF